MNLEKTTLDQLGNLLQSGKILSENIAEMTGQDKVTVTLITMGVVMTVAGVLRSMNV